ncbi:MAG TPA: inorganic phosphate transporter [Phycisphaerae bacterium]|jgi:PiT family inorganic phosphate transporter|nr:inorganic phosphate transporter [Phycisphaerae bacterium]
MFLAQTTTAAAGAPGISLGLILVIVAVALLFDFLNGFHDAANSIATVVSTRVLSPTQAVIWAALFNFLAAFLFGTKVASTISNNLINVHLLGSHAEQVEVIFAGLLAAIIWNIITWLLALPTSSSHALIAGYGGAAVAKAGFAVIEPTGWILVILGIFLAPILGFILGTINMIIVSWIFRFSTPSRVDALFRRLQLVSAGIYSLGHGGNDAQKTMGIIQALLFAAGLNAWASPNNDPHHWTHYLNILGHQHSVPWWIILTCNAAIGLGTMFGGWRIVKTMGSGITRLQPVGGFCAEAAAATTIIGFTEIQGVPISTTHAITGAILGVGTAKSLRSVRWIWGQRIVVAWILTLPCAAFLAAIAYLVIHLITHGSLT